MVDHNFVQWEEPQEDLEDREDPWEGQCVTHLWNRLEGQKGVHVEGQGGQGGQRGLEDLPSGDHLLN